MKANRDSEAPAAVKIASSDAGASSQPVPGDVAPKGTPGTGEAVCPECGGTGIADGRKCASCQGTGKVVQGVGGG